MVTKKATKAANAQAYAVHAFVLRMPPQADEGEKKRKNHRCHPDDSVAEIAFALRQAQRTISKSISGQAAIDRSKAYSPK